MKRILMAIMAVAVAVTFSAPSFAGDTKEEKEKKDKKDTKVLVYGDEKKKDEKEKPKDEKKMDEKGK
jgi:Ni/Co efflux regulator RcnB